MHFQIPALCITCLCFVMHLLCLFRRQQYLTSLISHAISNVKCMILHVYKHPKSFNRMKMSDYHHTKIRMTYRGKLSSVFAIWL